MAAVDPVGDTGDLRLRQRRLQEVEFTGAGVPVLERHPEHGAVVLGDHEATIIQRFKVGQIAILIKDPSHHRYLLGKCLVHGARPGPLQTAGGAAVEDPRQEGRVLLLDVLKQLVGQLGIGTGKQGVPSSGQSIEVLRPTRGETEPAVRQQSVPLERGQVLAHPAQGDADGGGDPLRICFPVSLDDIKDVPA